MYFTITFAEENDFFKKHSHVEVLVMANTIHAPKSQLVRTILADSFGVLKGLDTVMGWH